MNYKSSASLNQVSSVEYGIKRLSLNNFRNYSQAEIMPESEILVLSGRNGAGKTNILEAISLLTPGKGLRGAKYQEIGRLHSGQHQPWTVYAEIEAASGSAMVGTGLDGTAQGSDKRIVRINGKQASNEALAEVFPCLWITPRLSQIFQESAGERRRFLDRLVYNFDFAHAGRVSAFEKAVSERNRLLKDYSSDAIWLNGVEKQIASLSIAISAARLEAVSMLNGVISAQKGELFPKALLAVEGEVEELLAAHKALEAENKAGEILKASRTADTLSGRTSFGAHRSNLAVTHSGNGLMVELCSTGEQKALLISIILAAAAGKALYAVSAPVMLLDDLAAYLDEERRVSLFTQLTELKSQIWITCVDADNFAFLKGNAQFLGINKIIG